MKVKELLKGCRAGQIQTVGTMSVIPLLSDITDDRFVSPVKAKFETKAYGHMGFENTERGKILIVPLHTGYVTEKKAQDHAMVQAGVVKSKKDYRNASCIQQSQGGTVPLNVYDFLILPWALREDALGSRKVESYNKLWDSISRYNSTYGLPKRGHLEDFLDKFKKELDEFVAEFEVVSGQVGAIILINGTVFGIERTPSHEYFASIFKKLVREAYGSVAIQLAKGVKPVQGAEYNFRHPVRLNVETLDDIERALKYANDRMNEAAKGVVRDVIDEEVLFEGEPTVEDGMELLTVGTTRFNGQIIEDSGNPVYASLFARKDYLKNQKWYKAKEFEI